MVVKNDMKQIESIPTNITTSTIDKPFNCVSVIIASKNGLHHLKDCLPSVLKAVQKAPFETEIIVVDDNSTDNTLIELPNSFPQIKIIKNKKMGVCSARNTGVANSTGDWLFFADNDVFLEEDFFVKAQKYLKEDVFCVSCCGYLASEPTRQLDGLKKLAWKRGSMRFTGNIYNQQLKENKIYPSFGVQGAYFFCNKNRFITLSGFDEDLLEPYMLEETDLMYRGLKRGWKIVYAADTHPLHKCGGTIQSKTNKRTLFLSKRNSLIFTWKNITSTRLLLSSLLWCALRPNFKVFKEVINAWPIITKKRAIEKANQVVSDMDLLKQNNKLVESILNDK